MGREGKLIDQPVTQPIDISNWKEDDEFGVYPEGARDKLLLISPQESEYDFLVPNHRYLFKYSFQHNPDPDKPDPRHPDQFWTEIIAYRIGCMLNIQVPPAFVAFNSDNNFCGALIEWFLYYPNQPKESFVSGGDILVNEISGFDRKKGQQHNFLSIEKHFMALDKIKFHISNWLEYWCDMVLFDTLIGNTDRHQDNWGLLWLETDKRVARMAPVFDNGTSLGYEILETKMANFTNSVLMQNYILRGKHYLRWQLHNEEQIQHTELLLQLLNRYPDLLGRVKSKLALFKLEQLQSILSLCTQYPIAIPYSKARADFVCHLVNTRYMTLNEKINLLL